MPRNKDFNHKYNRQLDSGGKSPFYSLWGDQIITERVPDIQEQFQYNINTMTLTETTTSSGSTSVENNMAKLSTGSGTSATVTLESKNVIRYRPGFSGIAYFTAIWANGGVANVTQYIGTFSSNDGYFIGFDGTDFVVGRRFDGTDTKVSSSDFNGDGYFVNCDFTKLNIFRIEYGWLGTASIIFSYMGEDGEWHTIHTMQTPNTLTQPTSANPQLPICMDITKSSAGTTDVVMYSASWFGGIAGKGLGVGDRYFTGTTGEITNVSTEQVLINFQNVSTFQSVTNRVTVEGVKISASVDGTKPAEIKIYKNLTITSPSWSNVDATNSIMQTDTAGTVTPNNANLLWEYNLGKTDSIIDNIRDLDFIIRPGDTVTITGQSTANTTITFTARWREKF